MHDLVSLLTRVNIAVIRNLVRYHEAIVLHGTLM
jgi:hypothetical protein